MAIFTVISTGFTILKNLKYVKKVWDLASPFIGKHKAKLIGGVAIAIAVGCLYWYISSLQADVEHWKKEYNDKVTQIAVMKERCETNIGTLEGAIATQNGEIERIAGLLANAQVELDKRIAEAAGKQKQFEADIEKIRNEKKPETCEGSIEYLIKAKEELTW